MMKPERDLPVSAFLPLKGLVFRVPCLRIHQRTEQAACPKKKGTI